MRRNPLWQWPLTATIGLNFWSEVGSSIPMTSQGPQTTFARLLLLIWGYLILDQSSRSLIKKEVTLSSAIIGIGEPTSDQKLRPIVAVRGHCGLGSLFVEQMFKFENLFILVVWIFPLFSILLSLTADNWVRKVCVPSILSLEFSKLGVPLFLMIAAIP